MHGLERDWTAAQEKALVRKLDLHIMIPCCIIYVLAYLDRSNLSNVKILQKDTPDSFEESLGLQGLDFNWAVSISYFTLTAMLIPSALLMKKISAKLYFPLCMVIWGMIVMTMSACKSAPGLFTARFFLGLPESGIWPCGIMYFSFWYKPHERAHRIGVFYSSNSIAQAISGVLAVGIDNLNGHLGLKSWQWVFIIEGALPIALAIPIWWVLLTFPEDSKNLTDRERHIAINRLERGSTRKTDVTWDTMAFFRIMLRPSTYAFFFSYICIGIAAVAQATFLPTILYSLMKFSVQKANLYTAIINIVAVPIYWTFPLHSDWTKERMWHYLIPVAASIPCYAVWTYQGYHSDTSTISNMSLYGMAFLGQLLLMAQPVMLSYRSSTLYGAAEQAVGTSVTVGALSISSIIAPQMYPNKDAPNYVQGFSATVGLLAASLVIYATIPFWLQLEARQRKRKTGHALPLRSLEDSEHSAVSPEMLQRMREMQELEVHQGPEGKAPIQQHATEVEYSVQNVSRV
ncbi:uncharacterized protein PV06_00445 [Exophiala oligosperma]|uniref:Major facilitator superfamily (MFS) profile domain-containing protein n=2 Tax=Exophiala oligosperma TaxID=215243 RepID=A0A0D2CCY9_9EURO|nr:uncharacterized protein PV06_00445 [Exophiala oligosperma]KIW47782.1 hypothetical protein PV06_00445 [Exophiala oligosperma]